MVSKSIVYNNHLVRDGGADLFHY